MSQHTSPSRARAWVGAGVARREDPALLSGEARFIDDLAPLPGLKHAAILRSPHPHAEIRGIGAARAQALPGVVGVVTGRELASDIRPLASVVKAPVPYYPFAVDRVRFVGEPVAVVVAEDRYIAEDACELIDVDYAPLPAAADLAGAMAEGAPLLHEAAGSNVVSRRSFRYGDPGRAFAEADRVFEFAYSFPRYASTPIETLGVIAHYEPTLERFTVWSNFQGPFVLQPLMAGALGVRGNRLRLITPPHSGGSFGIKQAALSYIVLLAAVSRRLRCPVKWIEDRAEHLTAASASSDRLGKVSAAFARDGELLALEFHNVANMGAYIRPPEPASLYRMHAASSGPYRVRHIAIRNELVVTNQTPVGLNRGYGGPQFYFGLERVIEIAARGLGLDPAELRRRNFIKRSAFPYTAPAGAILEAGDFEAALEELKRLSLYDALLGRREEARRQGRRYGIGLAAGVEPSGSNMAYVSLAQPPAERQRGDPKSGASASAALTIDAGGNVTLRLCSTPNGQGHATVAAQIVADALGLAPADIEVITEADTLTSPWSIASGNYSNRFAAIVVDAIAQSAAAVADKLKILAAEALEASPAEIEFSDAHARVRGQSNRGVALRKLAARAHWDPVGLPEGMAPGISETRFLSPRALGRVDAGDRVASAATHGFVIDLVALEVDPATGRIVIDKYVSVHDVGRQLNPRIVEGQIFGGFVHGLGAALMEELAYDERGNFLSATFADYLCPTAVEVPELTVGHVETAAPGNALGAKGMGDGSSMLTPAALSNAVADALGRDDVMPPLTLQRVWALANGRPARKRGLARTDRGDARLADGDLTGEGEIVLDAPVAEVWRRLVDPRELEAVIPGCRSFAALGGDRYRGEALLGVAGVRGLYALSIELADKREPSSLRLSATAKGALGFASGEGCIALLAEGERTRLRYRYRASIGGKVATVGQRMLGAVTRLLIAQFFGALERRIAPRRAGWRGCWAWLATRLGRRAWP